MFSYLYIEAGIKRREMSGNSFNDDCEAIDQLENVSVDSGSAGSLCSSSEESEHEEYWDVDEA